LSKIELTFMVAQIKPITYVSKRDLLAAKKTDS
jgi:hypothetical protein